MHEPLWQFRPPVCLSVTLRYCINTAERRISSTHHRFSFSALIAVTKCRRDHPI